MKRAEELEEVIGQAIGEASMCWHPRPSGVFDSTYAIGITDRTVESVRKIIAGSFVVRHLSDIDKAILEERERCAKVAENMDWQISRELFEQGDFDKDRFFLRSGRHISQAIRKGET